MEEKNLLKQFMGKFEHDYLLALQQRLRMIEILKVANVI